MMRWLVLLSLLLAPAAHAEIYKCVLEGKTTFSQQPCAPADGLGKMQVIELDVRQPSAQAVKQQASIHAGMQANSRRIERDYNLMVLERSIQNSTESIALMMRERDARLAELRGQKSEARKSYEREMLALEIQRIKDAYATEIALEKERKYQYEREYSALRRSKPN